MVLAFGKLARQGWVRPLATLIFMIVLTTIFSPRADGMPIFWRPMNLFNVMRQISEIGILATGMTLVIIAGGIDLSVGSLLALSGCVFAYTLSNYGHGSEIVSGAGPFVLVAGLLLLSIAASGAFGLLSGIVITRLNLQPFIVTLAVMIAARGFSRWLVSNANIDFGYGDQLMARVADFLGLKAVVIPTFLAVAVLCLLLLNYTRFGRHLVAIGGSEDAARLSGIPITSVKLRVYTLSGLLAGLAGILHAAQTHQGSANAGIAYELDAIAAAVIGGTSLMGGKGSIFGTFVGALALGILANLLGLNNVDENIQWMLKAVIIIVAVWLQMMGRRGQV